MQLKKYISFLLHLLSIPVLGQVPGFETERKTEIDVLFSYYEQSGNHSAVTGGQGTEELHDYSGIIIVNVPIKENKTLRVENGISYFTSASHDNINPNTITSASYADITGYLDITYSKYDTAKRRSIGINVRGLLEEYFGSLSIGGFISKISADQNREFKASANLFADKWALDYKINKLYPIELKNTGIEYVKTDMRYSSNFNFILSQVINKRLQGSLSLGFINQFGLLNTPYHRVYFEGEDLPRVERMPDIKIRIPASIRLNYFMGDRIILRSFYRYYWDTFSVEAHTINLEVPIKITNFIAFQPFYRIHLQTGSKYFAPYLGHDLDAEYYTSDYDLSTFTSHFIGAGFKYSPAMGISKFKFRTKAKNSILFREIQLRGGSYRRSDGMKSMMVSCGFSFLY